MVLGIGTDLVDIRRIEGILLRRGERFISKLFSREERELVERQHFPSRGYAKRFAGKEAIFKAAGRGFFQHIRFCDIEILRKEESARCSGRPYVILSEKAQRVAQGLWGRVPCIEVSLSDEYPYAQAFAVLF